jgi:hypothetical protein
MSTDKTKKRPFAATSAAKKSVPKKTPSADPASGLAGQVASSTPPVVAAAHSGAATLAYLLHPVTVEDFFANYWEKVRTKY